MGLIVSLFDHTGIWSQPYEDAGYDVLRVDIQDGRDIWKTRILPDIHGLIIQPPCTDFASSGAQWWARKDADGRTANSVALVRQALQWVRIGQPDWWVLENPAGRIHKLIPELGQPVYKFQPYHFGDPYSKLTWLWGTFSTNLQRTPVRPHGMRPGQPPEWYSRVGGSSLATKNHRSATSRGFARSFFQANP